MTRVALPTAALASALGEVPAASVVVWSPGQTRLSEPIDLLVLPYMREVRAMQELDGIRPRLIQSQSIGYDGIEPLLPPGCLFANAAGVHEASTAELAVGLAIAAQRGIPGMVRAQDQGLWDPPFAPSLADRRVLLVGFGGVGKAIARRLAAFEVEISAVASRSRTEDGVRVHALEQLHTQLPLADVVILSLPATAKTRHIMDVTALSHMPDGALLVNVGRGALVDQAALLHELSTGRLRAALDVFEQEPLAHDNPLWHAPGTIITPHVGGASSAMLPRVAALVRRQVELASMGREPINVVLGG